MRAYLFYSAQSTDEEAHVVPGSAGPNGVADDMQRSRFQEEISEVIHI
jgi:hypothetical protein